MDVAEVMRKKKYGKMKILQMIGKKQILQIYKKGWKACSAEGHAAVR